MRKFIISTAIGSLSLGFYSCSFNEAGEVRQANKIKDQEIREPKLATVVSARPEFFITLPGELLPYEEVDIFPKVRGFVKKIYADRGAYVQKGQLLAVLEAPELTEAYMAKKASGQTAYQKYLFSKQAYDRLKSASLKSGSVAAIELERACSQLLADSAVYESSRAEAAVSRQLKDYLQIRAPFSGIVTARNFSEGALTGENNSLPVFRLAQTDKLRLTLAVPEKEKTALHAETEAVFTLIDMPGEEFKARFSRSSETVDTKLRSVIAEFDVDNRDKKMTAGQYAKVKLSLRRKEHTFWVPKTSVVHSQSGTFLIKAENGTAQRVPVLTGIDKDSVLEVFGNLEAGEKILFKGSEEVKEGPF